MTRTGWRLLLVALVALATRAARADEAKASMVVPPEKLEWKPSAALPAGAQIAVLQGAQTKPGPYAYRVRLPPHYRVPPHAHSDDRTYVFLSGTYYQGHGDRFDASRLAPVRAGGVLTINLHELNVEALPGDLPEMIEWDVAALEVGDTLLLFETG